MLFLATMIKRITINMLLFNTKLHVYVKFDGQKKPLNSSAKILGQQ